MIGRCVKFAVIERRADRASTMPSIMPLGATMSAPACAWLTACRASNSSVASLSTSGRPVLSLSNAAMPMIGVLAAADVGDDEQFGAICFAARIACWTMPISE